MCVPTFLIARPRSRTSRPCHAVGYSMHGQGGAEPPTRCRLPPPGTASPTTLNRFRQLVLWADLQEARRMLMAHDDHGRGTGSSARPYATVQEAVQITEDVVVLDGDLVTPQASGEM